MFSLPSEGEQNDGLAGRLRRYLRARRPTSEHAEGRGALAGFFQGRWSGFDRQQSMGHELP
jgi:hypothetical protein